MKKLHDLAVIVFDLKTYNTVDAPAKLYTMQNSSTPANGVVSYLPHKIFKGNFAYSANTHNFVSRTVPLCVFGDSTAFILHMKLFSPTTLKGRYFKI